MGEGIDRINAFRIVRIDIQLVVILGAAGHVIRPLFPTLAKIGAAVNATVFFLRLNDGVEHIGRRGRHGQADPAEVARRQITCNLAPGFTAIIGLVDATAGTAVDQRPDVSPALVTGRHDHVRVGRIDDEFIDARIFIDPEQLLPGLTSVAGLV